MSLCGAKATASTQNRAFGAFSCNVRARVFTSWIVPSILLACVQAAKTVFSDINGSRFSGVSFGFELLGSAADAEGVHHLITRF